MQSEPPATASPQRLHPISLLFSLGTAALRLLLPGIAALWALRGSHAEVWIMLLFVPAGISALVKYFTYRYHLRAEEIVVREGVVTRTERHIPYARIQNINLVQNPLHRLFRVSEVHLETAGGDEPEAVIRVLSLSAVARLRARVFRDREVVGVAETDVVPAEGSAVAPAQSVRELLRLPVGELILLGLISNRGTAVVAAALGLAWQLDLGIEERVEKLPRYFMEQGEAWTIPGPLMVVTLALAALVALVLGLRLLSVAWAILKFSGFKLTLSQEDLRASYGLFTRISATLPRRRVQLLSAQTRVLHRLCHRAAMQVETAGGAEGTRAISKLWLAPLIREDRVNGLLEEVLPEVRLDTVEWRSIDPRARRRIFRRTLLLVLAVTAAGFATLGWWGFAVPALGLPWAWMHATLSYRHAAYALTSSAVLYRSGWWVRRFSVVRFSKVQVLALSQSPFDRRYEMASVQVDTAGAGKVGHRIDIGFLEAGAARAVVARISEETGRTAFHW